MFGIINALNRNIFNNSSIQFCSDNNLITNKVECLRLSNGIQQLYNFNSSKNFAHRYSSISFVNFIKVNSSFCNYFNNSCKGFGVILFYSGTINNLFSFSNIIQNYQTSSGIVHAHIDSKPLLKNCIFKDNNFYLFNSQSGCLITLIDCYLIHSSNSYNIGSISLNNIKTSNTNTFKLSFLSLFNCVAIYPLQIKTYSNCFFTNSSYNYFNLNNIIPILLI